MMTTQHISKAGSLTGYSYERANATINRAALMLFHHWLKTKSQDRSSISKRLVEIAKYIDTTLQDEYLSNLYLIVIGSRAEGVPLIKALNKMETTRMVILQSRHRKTKQGFVPSELSQYIYDHRPVVKLKCLLRFFTALQTAYLHFEQLKEITRKEIDLNPEEEQNLNKLKRLIYSYH